MSNKIKEIFDNHQDKQISVFFGNQRINEEVMSKDAFVKIVSKLIKHTSTGEKFENIKELHNYLEI